MYFRGVLKMHSQNWTYEFHWYFHYISSLHSFFLQVDLCEVYSDCVTCLVQSINCNTTCPNNTEHEFIDVIMDTFYEINGIETL